VFWNSETGRTVLLKQRGVLSPYHSPQAADIPAGFKDPQGYWTGFAARCRILLYNTRMLGAEDLPESIFDLTQPRWQGQVALAYPLFGTTATHAAALFAHLGQAEARRYFEALRANDILITDGNASARDRVVDGTVALALTDTDDALVAMEQGHPVAILWPDSAGCGTLMIPNTVALIKGGPQPEHGRRLIDYLLSPAVEARLAHGPSGQIPLRADIERPAHVPAAQHIRAMDVDYEKVAAWMEPSARFLQMLYIR
jgi:iron(III) transport system substrate-binding protein